MGGIPDDGKPAPGGVGQRYDKASVMIGVLPIGRPQPRAEQMAAFFWSLKPHDADAAGARARQSR